MNTLDYNELAEDYARHRRVHPEVLRALHDALPADQPARVLEVGCGTGNYIHALAETTQWECRGNEPSEEMLAKAKARGGRVHFDQKSAEGLDFPANSLDFIFSVDVIHHVQDRAAYFAAAFRALKPGGRMVTVTDSEEIIRGRQPLSVYFPETVAAELARYPRMADLQEMMEAAGFAAVHSEDVRFDSMITEIENYRSKAFSSLHLIPQEAFEAGIRHMEADLQRGPLVYCSRYTLMWGRKPG